MNSGLIVLVRKLNRQPFSSPVGESTGGSRRGFSTLPAGQVERQAEAEGNAFLHFGDAFEHFLRRDEIEPAELIVVTPIAPGRAFRTVLPCASFVISLWLGGDYLAFQPCVNHARMAPPRNSANVRTADRLSSVSKRFSCPQRPLPSIATSGSSA